MERDVNSESELNLRRLAKAIGNVMSSLAQICFSASANATKTAVFSLRHSKNEK